MARQFNLVANLVLAGPSNLRPMVSSIQTSLNSIKANVAIQFTGATASTVQGLNAAFTAFNTTLKTTTQVASSAASAINSLGTAIKGVNLTGMNTQMKNAVTNTKAVAKATVDATNGMEKFGHVAGLAVRRFAGFALATGVIMGFGMAFKNAVAEAIKFQDTMVKLSQLSGSSIAGSYATLGAQIQSLSTTLGVSSAKLTEISHTLVQAGLSAKDMKDVMNALAKSMLAPAFHNVDQTIEGTIALMKQFNISGADTEKALSSMHAVAAKFAVESQDLITAVRIAGGAFAVMNTGVDTGTESLNKFMAIFTSIRATTRESAESIATGMRTIFTRLARPESVNIFKQLGVDLVDLEGKFIGPYEAINKISEAMKKMDPRSMEFLKIGEALGGYRQIGKVLPMLMQAETRIRALAVAQAGQNQLTDAAATAQESWTVQLTKTHERFLALIRDISQTGTFKAIMGTILAVANSFITLGDAIKPVIPLLTMVVGMKMMGSIAPVMKGFFGGVRGSKMAGGGLVPGSGNQDTHPAMLTPGEFVIRKDAVKAIGTGRLAQMNKYAGGGKVYGVAALETDGSMPVSNMSLDIKSLQNSNAGKLSGLTQQQIKTGLNASGIGSNVNIITKLVSPKVKDDFKNQMVVSLGRTARTGSKILTNSIGARSSRALSEDELKRSGLEAMTGHMFEASLMSAGAPYELSSSPIEDIDFPKGLQNIAKAFDIDPNIPTEAKKILNKKQVDSVYKKIYNDIGKQVKNNLSLSPEEEKTASNRLLRAKAAARMKKASGGSVDTVPAMLTPGEFVINKNAASRIGLHTLRQMNHADKVQGFAQGGSVQYFAAGDLAQNPTIQNRMSSVSSATGFSGQAFEKSMNGLVDKIEAMGGDTKIANQALKDLSKALQSGKSKGDAFTESLARAKGRIDKANVPPPGSLAYKTGRATGRALNWVGNTADKFGGMGAMGMMAGASIAGYAGPESQIGQAVGGGLMGISSGKMLGEMMPGKLGKIGGIMGMGVGAAMGIVGGIREAQAASMQSKATVELQASSRELDKAFNDLAKGAVSNLAEAMGKAASAVSAQAAVEEFKNRTSSGNLYGMTAQIDQDVNAVSAQKGLPGMLAEGAMRWAGGIQSLWGGTSITEGLNKQQDQDVENQKKIRLSNYAQANVGIGTQSATAIEKLIAGGTDFADIGVEKGGKTKKQAENEAALLRGYAKGNLNMNDSRDQARAEKWSKIEAKGDTGSKEYEYMLDEQATRGREVGRVAFEMAEKLRILNSSISRTNIVFEDFAHRIEKLSSKISISGHGASGMVAMRSSLLSGGLMTTSEQQSYNMFKNPNAHTGEQMANQLRNMTAKYGGADNKEVQAAAGYIESGNNFSQGVEGEVNRIIEKYKTEKKTLTGENLKSELQNSTIFTNLSEEQQTAARNTIDNGTKGQSITAQNWLENGGIKDMRESVNKGTESSYKLSAEILDKINGIQEEYLKSIQDQLNLQNQINEKMSEAASLQATHSLNLEKVIHPYKDMSVEEQYAPVKARLESLGAVAGLNAQQSQSPAALGQKSSKLLAEQAALKGKMAEIKDIKSPEYEDLRKQEAEVVKQLEAIKKGGEILHTDNTKLNAIQEKLSQVREQKSAIGNTILDLASMGAGERFRFMREMTAYGNVRAGGVPQSQLQLTEAIAGFRRAVPLMLNDKQRDAAKREMLGAIGKAAGNLTPGARKLLEDQVEEAAKGPLVDQYRAAADIQLQAANLQIDTEKSLAESVRTLADAIREAGKQGIIDSLKGSSSLPVPVGPVIPAGPGIPPITSAKGGIVPGHYTGGDSVPAMLSAGEFVVRRSATQQNMGLLQAINNGYARGGVVRRYADGGVAKPEDWEGALDSAPTLKPEDWEGALDSAPVLEPTKYEIERDKKFEKAKERRLLTLAQHETNRQQIIPDEGERVIAQSGQKQPGIYINGIRYDSYADAKAQDAFNKKGGDTYDARMLLAQNEKDKEAEFRAAAAPRVFKSTIDNTPLPDYRDKSGISAQIGADTTTWKNRLVESNIRDGTQSIMGGIGKGVSGFGSLLGMLKPGQDRAKEQRANSIIQALNESHDSERRKREGSVPDWAKTGTNGDFATEVTGKKFRGIRGPQQLPELTPETKVLSREKIGGSWWSPVEAGTKTIEERPGLLGATDTITTITPGGENTGSLLNHASLITGAGGMFKTGVGLTKGAFGLGKSVLQGSQQIIQQAAKQAAKQIPARLATQTALKEARYIGQAGSQPFSETIFGEGWNFYKTKAKEYAAKGWEGLKTAGNKAKETGGVRNMRNATTIKKPGSWTFADIKDKVSNTAESISSKMKQTMFDFEATPSTLKTKVPKAPKAPKAIKASLSPNPKSIAEFEEHLDDFVNTSAWKGDKPFITKMSKDTLKGVEKQFGKDYVPVASYNPKLGRISITDRSTIDAAKHEFAHHMETRSGILDPKHQNFDKVNSIIDRYKDAIKKTSEYTKASKETQQYLLKTDEVYANIAAGTMPEEMAGAKEWIRARKTLLSATQKGLKPYELGGPATGTDSVPALLTPGEFVVNRGATSRNRGLLESINQGGFRRFADGGIVSTGAAANGGGGSANFESSLNNFYSKFEQLFNKIPTTLNISGEVTAKIDLNGASALATALAAEVAPIIKDYINSQLPKTGTVDAVTGETNATSPGRPLGA